MQIGIYVLAVLLGLCLGAVQAGLLSLTVRADKKRLYLLIPLKPVLWALSLWGMARISVPALIAFAISATCALWFFAYRLLRKARKEDA